jgi:hypothetical protein
VQGLSLQTYVGDCSAIEYMHIYDDALLFPSSMLRARLIWYTIMPNIGRTSKPVCANSLAMVQNPAHLQGGGQVRYAVRDGACPPAAAVPVGARARRAQLPGVPRGEERNIAGKGMGWRANPPSGPADAVHLHECAPIGDAEMDARNDAISVCCSLRTCGQPRPRCPPWQRQSVWFAGITIARH